MVDESYQQYQYQNALQTQAGEAQNVPYAPQLQEQVMQAQAVLVAQTNPDKILKEIILKLKGIREDFEGKYVKEGSPMMNEDGIAVVKFALSSILNQSTVLSHVEDPEINRLMIYMHDNLNRDLAKNWRNYDIKDREMLNHIEGVVIVPAFLALKRALEQNEKNWLGRITVENIHGKSDGNMKPNKGGSWYDKIKL